MRTNSLLRLAVLLAACTLCTVSASADDALDNPTRSERNPPSMLQYGFAGLGTGLLIGASAGYLVARDPDWDYSKRDWRALGLGTGIGALSGMALGLGLGAADLGADAPGYGGVVLRDTLYGTGLGAVAGAIGGTISAFAQSEGEHVLFGTAIGLVSGAGVGMIIGFIQAPRDLKERQREDQRKEQKEPKKSAARSALPTLGATRDANNQLVWVLGSTGRF